MAGAPLFWPARAGGLAARVILVDGEARGSGNAVGIDRYVYTFTRSVSPRSYSYYYDLVAHYVMIQHCTYSIRLYPSHLCFCHAKTVSLYCQIPACHPGGS